MGRRRATHRSILVAGAVLLAAAGCGDEASSPPDPDAPATTDATTTSTPPPASDTSTTTTSPDGDLTRCESQEGYAIGYPETWHTNEGDVVARCGQFHPEPFEVPAGTDERVAAITASVDAVPYADAVTAPGMRDADRAVTAVDGLQAVRLAYTSSDDGLWPAGTPITTYAVDLSPDLDDPPRTLFVDTVGTPPFDYERNVEVLDRMARTLEVTADDVATSDGVVATYAGGGGGFTVEAEVTGDETCLRIPPGGEPVCTEVPGADELLTAQFFDLGPVLGGVTGDEVFRVDAEWRDGSTTAALPVRIGETDVRGFSFTEGLDGLIRLRWYDITGDELGSVQPGG